MTKRLNFMAHKNSGIDCLVAVEAWIARSFDPKLLELVKVRVSQMNGCANCLHMRRQDALKRGETDDRLLLLNAWRESQLFSTGSGRHSAGPRHSPTSRKAMRRMTFMNRHTHFSDDEFVALSIGIAMINAWNRLAIGFRLQHPADHKRAAA